MLKKINFLFLIMLSFSVTFSCSSDSDSNDDDDGHNPDEYVYFISGKINGESFIHGQRTNATEIEYNATSSNSLSATCAYHPETGGYNYGVGVYPDFDDTANPALGIEFVRFHLCTDEDSQLETFNDKFQLGYYNLASSGSAASGPTNVIGFNYTPNADDGPYYLSYGGDQTGSYFEITSSTEFNGYVLDVLVSANQIVEGKFAAKFYNEEDPTDVIEITDGRFKMIPGID